MKVDGDAFRRAREEIKKNAPADRGTKYEPGIGTQRWLANVSKVRTAHCKKSCGIKCTNKYKGECVMRSLALRTIQKLEKGNGSPQTISAVSPHLKINGFEYTDNFGSQQVKIDIPKVIDLRSEKSRNLFPDKFAKTRLMLTLDPVTVSFEEGDSAQLHVESMNVQLNLGDVQIGFNWLYEVQIVEGRNDKWLGNDAEVAPFTLSNKETWRKSVMFNQIDFPPLNWDKFLELVKSTELKAVEIELTVICTYVTKRTKVLLAISQLQQWIEYAENELEITPARLQPSALSFSSTP